MQRTVLRVTLAALAALALWIAADFARPVRTDIRVFDAARVAALDTDMWRSYYDRRPLVLYGQMAQLLREEFHFPFWRSWAVAYEAARAAFVFKDGHGRADYERALPALARYYAAIRSVSATAFDVRAAARTELEWWIVHRERSRRDPEALDRALREGAAALYATDAARLEPYGRERTIAMRIRDSLAVSGGLTDADWAAIDAHLRVSWAGLRDSLAAGAREPRK